MDARAHLTRATTSVEDGDVNTALLSFHTAAHLAAKTGGEAHRSLLCFRLGSKESSQPMLSEF